MKLGIFTSLGDANNCFFIRIYLEIAMRLWKCFSWQTGLTFRAISVTSIILELLSASAFHVIITKLPLPSWQSFSQISKLISQLSLIQQGVVRPPVSDRRHVSSCHAASTPTGRPQPQHQLNSVNWCQRRGCNQGMNSYHILSQTPLKAWGRSCRASTRSSSRLQLPLMALANGGEICRVRVRV